MKLLESKILVFGIIFAFIGGFVFYFFNGAPWDLISYKNKIGEYLEKKYDKDFVIEKTTFDFFHGKTYHSYAHPKESPDLSFYVGQNPSTREIEDSYLNQLWNKQAKDELGPIVEKFFPDNFNYAIEIYPINKLSIRKELQNINFREYSSVEIGISMNNYEITNENFDREILRAYLLLDSLKETSININHFDISYKNKTIQLQPEEIRSISTSIDLERWLNDYN